jgi:hypothetical protein
MQNFNIDRILKGELQKFVNFCAEKGMEDMNFKTVFDTLEQDFEQDIEFELLEIDLFLRNEDCMIKIQEFYDEAQRLGFRFYCSKDLKGIEFFKKNEVYFKKNYVGDWETIAEWRTVGQAEKILEEFFGAEGIYDFLNKILK